MKFKGYLKRAGVLLTVGMLFLNAGKAVSAQETGTGFSVKNTLFITFEAQNEYDEKFSESFDMMDTTAFKIPEYEGYDFIGWNDKQDGTGTFYENPSQLIKSLTLYGIWEEKPEGELISSKKMYIGESCLLVLKNAEGELIWESQNPRIADVEEGLVTAYKKGKTVISVTQYGKTYQCRIEVKAPDVNRAYGIFLGNIEKHKNMTYYLINLDNKGEKELVVINQLPVTIPKKETKGNASYANTTKKKVEKVISFYRYNKGKVVLMKRLKYKDNILIMKHKYSNKLLIMDMKSGSTLWHFISGNNGKVACSTSPSGRTGEYTIITVSRSTDSVIKKEFKYTVPKKKKNKK